MGKNIYSHCEGRKAIAKAGIAILGEGFAYIPLPFATQRYRERDASRTLHSQWLCVINLSD
ncbi:hypothetical protein H6G27_15960 [Nostoc linckia FACHB-104]|nr:hypothetical protein [Nostoc linckia FACHB-104]